MEHWLDRVARDLASSRQTRRTFVRRGLGGLAAGGLFGGWELGRRASAAAAKECGVRAAPECAQIATEAGQVAQAACHAESPANQAACLHGVANAQSDALAKCLQDKKANGACSICEMCFDGECIPRCLAKCTKCSANTGACVDSCPEGEVCNPQLGDGGECIPRCPQQCTSYNGITASCDDACTEKNPCMVCRQNQCQSNCPDPSDFCQDDGTCRHCDASKCQRLVNGRCVGCDSTCETCQDGQCVSTCAAGKTCCLGQCLTCCQSSCDHSTGLCTGNECTAEQACCPNGTCADVQSDPTNCGTCGHICDGDEQCLHGECRQDCSHAGADPCPTGSMCCATSPSVHECIDVSGDANNCGDCGHVCSSGESCFSGECGFGPCDGDTCLSSQTCCHPHGCVDLQTSPNDCGTCGNACPDDTPFCLHGQCSPCDQDFPAPCGPADDPNSQCCLASDVCCPYTNQVTGEQQYECVNPDTGFCCQWGGGCNLGDNCMDPCGCCPSDSTFCTDTGLCGFGSP